MPEAIVVTYYHSVGAHDRPRPKSFLSIDPDLFEQQVCRLLGRGFSTVTLQDTWEYVSGRRELAGPEVVLTFDDGFLDNWVNVYPLARKLGFKYTIFVNPDFVDPRDIVRPTLDDVTAGKLTADQLEWWGFLSWPEMRLMEQSGLVDIQSHTMSHTWHFKSNNVIDYHRPGDRYPWLIWNSHPQTRPFWMSGLDETLVPFGVPVYEYGLSIPVRRYLPDERLDQHLAEYVAEHGGAGFFATADWKEQLDRCRQNFVASFGDHGRYEDDDAHVARIEHEVVQARRIIQDKLGKDVRFVCWPGGGESELARRIAIESGHLATTRGTRRNAPGIGDPSHIFRVAPWVDARIPQRMKWWIADGQFDRARGVRTARGVFASMAARIHRLFR